MDGVIFNSNQLSIGCSNMAVEDNTSLICHQRLLSLEIVEMLVSFLFFIISCT